MARKQSEKLTPYQIDLLKRIKKHSTWRVTVWYGNSTDYRVAGEGVYEAVKTGIGFSWHKILAAFFTNSHKDGTTFYKFRREAVISDEWMQAELQKQDQERQDAQAAKEAHEEAQRQAATAYLNEGSIGHPYAAEMSGTWPFGGQITFDGEWVADIKPATYSTNDKTFADILKRGRNVPHFERIRRLIVAANKNA